MTQGPKVRALIAAKMSADVAIRPGDPVQNLLACLSDPRQIKEGAEAATEWAQAVIQAVKSTRDNPHGDDDEAIAGAILDGIKARDEARKARERGTDDRPAVGK
jgi:hypothetical protein